MNLIGISGRIGSGKDLTGNIIQYLTTGEVSKVFTFEEWVNKPHYSRDAAPWQIKKFAAKMKQCVSIITGIPVEDLEKIEVKNSLIGTDWGDITYRKLLQLLGTEVGRCILPDFWINALFSRYTKTALNWDADGNTTVEAYPNWIITDCRFENEIKAIYIRGGITIRLQRNSQNVVSDHTSETSLDNYSNFDYVIDNSNTTINELIQIVKNILIIEQIITID